MERQSAHARAICAPRGRKSSPWVLWAPPLLLLAALLSSWRLHSSPAGPRAPSTGEDANALPSSAVDRAFFMSNFTFAAQALAEPSVPSQDGGEQTLGPSSTRRASRPPQPCGAPCSALARNPCLVPRQGGGEVTAPGLLWVEWGPPAGQRDLPSSSVPWQWLPQVAPQKGTPPTPGLVPWHMSALAARCGFRAFSPEDAVAQWRGKHIVLAGDSQVRKVLEALLRLLAPSMRPAFPRQRHLTFVLLQGSMRIDYLFCPYPADLSAALEQLALGEECPDVLVLGSGIWHMVYNGDAREFAWGLRELRGAVLRLTASRGCPSKRGPPGQVQKGEGGLLGASLFWVDVPELVPEKVRTEKRRVSLTPDRQLAYQEATIRSKIAAQAIARNDSSWSFLQSDSCSESASREREGSSKGHEEEESESTECVERRDLPGPLLDLQLLQLSRACGESCTDDGMHYSESVYDAVVQNMVNLDAMEKRQQPEPSPP